MTEICKNRTIPGQSPWQCVNKLFRWEKSEIFWNLVKWKRIPELLNNPKCGRMAGYIEMNDYPSL